MTLRSPTVERCQGRVWIVKKEGGFKDVFSLKWHRGGFVSKRVCYTDAQAVAQMFQMSLLA